MEANISLMEDLKQFLDDSPTAWHAVKEIIRRLKENGFEELKEEESWDVQSNQSYFVQRNHSSLCAFITPQSFPERIRLLASHTDSPALKLKPEPEIRKNQAVIFAVEVYGGPVLNSWLNRDLGLAGRIVYKSHQGNIQESLVNLNRHPLIIPQLAIHLDREVNEKGLILNKQDHLNALAALDQDLPPNSSYLETLIREEISFAQLLDFDLFLVPLEKACFIGYNQQLLASYRIDNLSSAHAILYALLKESHPHKHEIKMAMFWDNEEIGSQTAQGADSPFFNQTLERILWALEVKRDDHFRIMSRSTCFSVDLAHSLHPNHVDKHDPQHQPILGKGVVLKYNAQQKYATSARSSVPIHVVAEMQKIPLQKFVSRNEMPCGSTIGPIHASRTGMSTVDIGCGQLSMHSCREILSCQDQIGLSSLLESLMKVEKWPDISH